MARLDEICVINMGQSPDSLTYNEEGNGLPFFQVNADFGEIYPMVRMWCSEPTKIAQEKDILISVRAPIGALNIANCECCIGRGLAGLTVNEDICVQDYLWYALSSKVDELNSKGTGSTFKAINKKILAETEIPLLPLAEQRKIAAVLDQVSNLIAKRRQQLDKLDELVKSRFMEMFGDPIDNTMGLRSMPLGEACYLKAGITTSADAIHDQSAEYPVPCYGGNGIRGYVEKATQSGCYPIVGRQGALCGNVQLVTGEFHATEHAVLVTPIIEANVVWLFHLLKLMDLYRFHTGAAQPGLAVKTLNTVTIPIADIHAQEQFAAFVAQTDKSKLAIQKSLEKLEILKKSLMQKYFG